MIRLVSVVRLGSGWTVRFRPIWFWAVGLGPIVRLGCRRTVRFRLVIRGRPVGTNGVVLWMRCRRIRRWLNSGTIDCGVIRRPCLSGRYNCAVVQRSRLRSSGDWRCAMVHGSSQLWFRAGSLRMLSLNGHRRDMSLMCHSLFSRRWTRADPSIATVVADPVHRGVVDHRGVVNIVNVGDVHVVHQRL